MEVQEEQEVDWISVFQLYIAFPMWLWTCMGSHSRRYIYRYDACVTVLPSVCFLRYLLVQSGWMRAECTTRPHRKTISMCCRSVAWLLVMTTSHPHLMTTCHCSMPSRTSGLGGCKLVSPVTRIKCRQLRKTEKKMGSFLDPYQDCFVPIAKTLTRP